MNGSNQSRFATYGDGYLRSVCVTSVCSVLSVLSSSGGEQRSSAAGAWRDGERPAPEPARTPYGGRDSRGRDDDRLVTMR